MKKVFWALLLASLIPAGSHADIKADEQQVTVNLGWGFPLSTIDITGQGGGTVLSGGPGFSGGAQMLYHVKPQFSLGADFNYFNSATHGSNSYIGGADTSSSYTSTVLLAVARWNILPAKRLMPYLLGGAGFHSSTITQNAKPLPGFVWGDTGTNESRNIADDNNSGFAAAAGAGVNFFITNDFFLGLEGRYNYLGSATYNTSPQGQSSTGLVSFSTSLSSMNVLASVGYKFALPIMPPHDPRPRRSRPLPA